MVSKFGSGEAAPNAELLGRVDGVVPAGVEERTICAKGFGSLDGLFSDYPIWNVLREEHLWQPFARYFPHAANFEQEFAVWMSGVEHKLNGNGDEQGPR